MDIQALFERARQYADRYPGVADDATRDAIFWTHLAWLINHADELR